MPNAANGRDRETLLPADGEVGFKKYGKLIMSKEIVKKMFSQIEKDANLQKKYAETMQSHQIEAEKVLAGKLVELGKTSGFDFSKNDLLAARAELIDSINANNELSEKDLQKDCAGLLTTSDPDCKNK